MTNKTARLLEIFLETSSFLSDPDPKYRLASGLMSNYYVDCKKALSWPEARAIIGELIVDLVRSRGTTGIDAVGGLALGAYPIAVAVSDAYYRMTGETVRAFVVRKDPKSHGLQKHIEGDVKDGDKVIIVDDVITTGRSTIDAIEKSREEGLIIVASVAVVDRQQLEGAQNIKECGVAFTSLVTLADLKSAQAKSGSVVTSGA